ncbi:MAG: hypothetical protein ACR2O3_02980 [Rhizobiaceae bacterium]
MKLVLYLFGRLIVVCFALIVALLAASLFIGFGFASGIMEGFLDPEVYAETRDEEIGNIAIGIATFVIAVFTGINLAGFTVLPTTIAVAVTEMMRWQSLTIQLVLGGLCALFTMFTVLALPAGELPSNGSVIIALAAGFVATFFYWLIAGRNAGEWLSALGEENSERES